MMKTRSNTNFERAIPVVLRFEGGYVNDPDDPGGETNFGISKRTYPSEDIRSLTRERAALLYRRDYWDSAKCDKWPWALCLIHFDAAVNHGLKRARSFLQQTYKPEEYIALREAFYRGIVKRRPKSRKFLRGWLRRLNHLRQLLRDTPS